MDFDGLLSVASEHLFASITALIALLAVLYVFYYRNIHPLSKYPGPFLASFTNLWKVQQLWSLHLPDTLIALHEKHGDIVRIGPNQLSFRQGDAVPKIYKAGRTLAKTPFYDGFTSFNPNLFGTQDEEVHSLRRRQMAHAFSLQSIKEMEQYIDEHLVQFRRNLDEYSKTGQVFDLKELIAFFVLDVLGDLAFRCQFNSQVDQDASKLPPINDHIFLACLLGMIPDLMPFIKAISPWTPVPWLQQLLAARRDLKNLTAKCVSSRMADTGAARKDLITSLINAVDPQTGARLTELDIQTEAFAFIVAGSHTTSGTLTLLFSHILQNPAIHAKVVDEVDATLANVESDIIPIEGLETKLPYLMACLNENFRMNSVFTMPLERRVTAREGFEIGGHVIPKGTVVFSLNHVVHHNPSIWGTDHNKFDPSRFLSKDGERLQRFLSPFSMGHRMCIGRNMAMTNMLKLVATTFKNYHLEMEDPTQIISTISVGISEKEGPLMCRVRRR
ncbi:cytochrome P450 [Fusarium solani]|uniref:Cytochrome P450 n=1 Tax=Fusarium solani TaxID=169388 RepID=A0A9P9GZW0_FUSSL|nr:cytochrome P450 [Fusarium solani]KAH7247760.1 cytochrome P450 [Fusarium solani]